ncbi:MAG: hypothetical protein ACFFG0_40610 [Candidatus Thorarchaeota archaeon]
MRFSPFFEPYPATLSYLEQDHGIYLHSLLKKWFVLFVGCDVSLKPKDVRNVENR